MEDAGGGLINGWFAVILMAATFASMWKVFVKAGEPGWASLVPIYNAIVMLKIAGKPAWWIVLMMIPAVNVVVVFMVMDRIAKSFGGGTGFTLGLMFLSWVFFLILGFGERRYQATAA
jgi:cobalamin synthase